jgi:hypothetical protein
VCFDVSIVLDGGECWICVGMICACICISYYCMLSAELLEPSELFGTSDSWLPIGVVEQCTKACRSERQHLFVLCRSAASTVCTQACCTATGAIPFVLHCC